MRAAGPGRFLVAAAEDVAAHASTSMSGVATEAVAAEVGSVTGVAAVAPGYDSHAGCEPSHLRLFFLHAVHFVLRGRPPLPLPCGCGKGVVRRGDDMAAASSTDVPGEHTRTSRVRKHQEMAPAPSPEFCPSCAGRYCAHLRPQPRRLHHAAVVVVHYSCRGCKT